MVSKENSSAYICCVSTITVNLTLIWAASLCKTVQLKKSLIYPYSPIIIHSLSFYFLFSPSKSFRNEKARHSKSVMQCSSATSVSMAALFHCIGLLFSAVFLFHVHCYCTAQQGCPQCTPHWKFQERPENLSTMPLLNIESSPTQRSWVFHW